MSKQPKIKPVAPLPPEAKASWRDELTVDERATVQRAAEHATFWAGAWSMNPLMLIDKLAKLLDERS